jgi:hypothetical protein
MIRNLFVRETLSTKQAVGAGMIGVVTGALITYFLYGTEKGAQKRKVLTRVAKEVKDLAQDAIEDLKYSDEEDEIEITNKK